MNTPCYLVFANAQPAQGQGSWSFTVQPLDGSPALSACDCEPEVSGERLELLALVRALEALDQPGQVMVCCDNARIERQLNQGLDEWRDAGWRWEAFGAMTPIPNGDLWRRIDRAMHIHRVSCRRTSPTLAPLATGPAAGSLAMPSDVEPAATRAVTPVLGVIRHEDETDDVAVAPRSLQTAVTESSRPAPSHENSADMVQEPATLPLPASRPVPPKKRRPRRSARNRQAPSWDQLIANLRDGMQRLRTVAATLA